MLRERAKEENPEQSLGEAPSVVFDIDWDDKPVEEVFGNSRSMAKYGPPSQTEDRHVRYYFYPTWRSQLIPLVGFFILSGLTVWASGFPYMVLKGKLFALFGTTYFLDLPILVLIPGFLLGRVLLSIYDAQYIIDERGVEAHIGLVSLNLRQPRLRWEDIRGVEPNQTLWERILGIGSVLIGSAMTQDIEIIMSGVGNPRAIQLIIQGERDRHLKMLRKKGRDYQAISGD